MTRARATNRPWARAISRSRAETSPARSRPSRSPASVVWPIVLPPAPRPEEAENSRHLTDLAGLPAARAFPTALHELAECLGGPHWRKEYQQSRCAWPGDVEGWRDVLTGAT